ncbi:MAG: alpha-amylase [Muribaculaceae bacterium]|nr:alpha-amylase [Muribaculaceae bacterium]
MEIRRLIALMIAGALLLPLCAKKQQDFCLVKADSPSPEWLESAVIYEANLRQGTTSRDLKGLQRELPRLKDLGVDVIWLMPIHPISQEQRKGTFGSYYAVQDYKAVNPEFGTMEDLKEFVRTAHAHGMKVILDEVCNHTGADHKWVTEHPEYYALNEKGEKYGPYDWTDVYKLDYSNPATRAAMTDALKFWIEEADIDGYRCDVAGEVPTDYWEEARPQLQAIKPILMLAESSTPSLLVKAFDVDYAWPMKDVFNAIAATKGINKWAAEHKENRPKMSASDIPALIERQKKEFPADSRHMNMVTNHDLNSWEGTEFDRFGPATGAFATLSYTLPGVPMMYTGQEVGFNHPFEFFEQDSIQPVYEANEFTAFYERLNSLKHNNRALDASVPADFYSATNPDILCFVREVANPDGTDNKVMVIANLSNEKTPLIFKAKGIDVNDLTNIFSGEKAVLPAELEPWQYIVLAK